MRIRVAILSLLFCWLCSITTSAQIVLHPNVNSQLLTIAKKYVPESDVDYFLIDDGNTNHYIVFVDAEPMKSWQHKCYYVYIPKPLPANINNVNAFLSEGNMPPIGNLTPLSVKDRDSGLSDEKPYVQKVNNANLPGSSCSVGQRTYALIVSGGISPYFNYQRYWNDCSFIYQTLVNKYGVPKENIYPIMSDGENPGPDMNEGGYKLITQPLDLDFDGVQDIKLAATKANIESTLIELSDKLQKDDHLFIYVIDHGGTDDYLGNSYICLWNGESLYDKELADMLDPITSKFVNVNVVLGQCFSGGFIDDLKKVGCVVATASAAGESSYASANMGYAYDEFVYRWTCAINEADHTGNVLIKSDINGDGKVTMDEAFNYAKIHDLEEETPQYVSTPVSIGEDLAFNSIVSSVDLYIKDNVEDTGKVPNLTTNEYWRSPSICVRNRDDGVFEYQNPEYSSNHPFAYVYVRVHNRGKEQYKEGKYLKVYWSLASTDMSANTWLGNETYINESVSGNNKYLTGGMVGIVPIEGIESGEYRDVKVQWLLPVVMRNYPDDKFYFSLLAEISDNADDISEFDVKNSNNLACINTVIINKKDISKDCDIFVRNATVFPKSYTLELLPRTDADAAIFSNGSIDIELSPGIYTAWGRGGYKGVDLRQSSSGTFNPRRYTLTSRKSKLENICLFGNEFDFVKFNFLFNSLNTQSVKYTLDLVQKDEDGNIVNGATLIVEPPMLYQYYALDISSTPIDETSFQLTANNDELNSIQWRNVRGDVLANAATVTVIPKENDNTYVITGLTEDGDVVMDKISIESNLGIKTLCLNSDHIDIILRSFASENEVLVLSSLDNNITVTEKIIPGTDKISIDTLRLPKGIYVISYLVNGEVISQEKINL